MSKGKFEVKNASAWVKNRWSLVAFLVIALLLVPAMVYFALGMITSRHTAFEEQVKKDSQDFISTAVKYTVPPVVPNQPAIEQTYQPNEGVIKKFEDALNRQEASAAGVVDKAVEHNKGGRKPLLDNVFPNLSETNLALAKQFRRVYVGEAVTALLETINAKPPMPATDVAARLAETKNNFLQRELGTNASATNAEDQLPEEKRRSLTDTLLKDRLGAYRQWGEKLSVYATPAIFTLPPVIETETPTPTQLWEWQVQYWTMQDIMTAVADANASAKDLGVSKSVVKRIERVVVDPVLPPPQSGAAAPIDPAAAAPVAAPDGPDYTKSLTGRKTGSLYDVVNVNMVCVVATKDLPRFFDALGKTNLMTVTRVKLGKVDLAADLRDGYFYGEDGVTRVDMSVEALWLREWTKELMPKDVKVALGLESGDPNAVPGAAPTPGAAPAPAAPPPSGRRAGSVGG
ncbi:MAG TPA: hypothetical protein VFF65_01430 [Phycisphaerales bacterium]|nr:hypothetical protein [Phycisphaerales bacterium]